MNQDKFKQIALADIGKKVSELYHKTNGFKSMPDDTTTESIKRVYYRVHSQELDIYDNRRFDKFREYASIYGLEPGRYWNPRIHGTEYYMKKKPTMR